MYLRRRGGEGREIRRKREEEGGRERERGERCKEKEGEGKEKEGGRERGREWEQDTEKPKKNNYFNVHTRDD